MHCRYNTFEGMLTDRIWQSPLAVMYRFNIFNIVNKFAAKDLKLKMPIILVMSGIYLLIKNVSSVTPGYKRIIMCLWKDVSKTDVKRAFQGMCSVSDF